MERDWGESCSAVLYARISDEVTLKDVDQRVLELVADRVKDSESDLEKAQRLIHFQIMCESCVPKEYEYLKKNGNLGSSQLASVLESHDYGLTDVPNSFIGHNTKVKTQFGYLSRLPKGVYRIFRRRIGGSTGAGLYVSMWNSVHESITKEDCDKMMSYVTDVIKKYPRFVEIVCQE